MMDLRGQQQEKRLGLSNSLGGFNPPTIGDPPTKISSINTTTGNGISILTSPRHSGSTLDHHNHHHHQQQQQQQQQHFHHHHQQQQQQQQQNQNQNQNRQDESSPEPPPPAPPPPPAASINRHRYRPRPRSSLNCSGERSHPANFNDNWVQP
ncbi:hypothetical protein Syun_015667 [Stephania yunnanensis]|uniref:Uncharacterized protein n=1 Tax=Stephania yunnanensis TaxID=152371 RepID=A0AAP0JNZ4_9MAGN